MMKNFFILIALALMVYSCSNDSEKLTDPAIDAKVVMQLGHYWGVSDLCFFPDGKKMVTSGWDASVRVWDIDLSRELMVFKGNSQEESYGNIVKLGVSNDGKTIAAASERGKVYLFNAEEGTLNKTVDVANNRISALAFSPDGKTIACGGYNKTISIIDATNGSIVNTLEGHTGSVNDIDFNKDGKKLVSAGNDSSFIVWDLEAKKQIKKIKFKFNVSVAKFSSDNKLIAVNVNYDKKIYLYDSEKYAEKGKLEEYCTHFIFNNNNQLITINGAKTQIWDVNTKQVVQEIKNGGSYIKISPDGKTLANADMSGVELYEISSGNLIKNFTMNVRTPYRVHSSPTGKFLVTENSHISSVGGPDLLSYAVDTNFKFKSYHTSGSGANILAFEGNDKDMMLSEISWGDLNFYDLTSGNIVRGIKDKVTTPVCISPDGKTLVAKDKTTSNSYGIFDITNGEKKQELINTQAYHYFSDISPDGKYYAMLTMDFFKVWEIPSGKEAKAYQGRNDFDNVLFFNMIEDKYVVGMNMSGYFILKDVMNNAEILRTDVKTGIRNAAISPDKKTISLACEDWTIKIIDIASKNITSTIKGHEASVTSVAFSKTGKYIFSTSQDKMTKVWDAATGKELLTILGLEKLGQYEGEGKDFVVIAPNGRIDGTKEAIEHVLYLKKGKDIVPVQDYWSKIYTPNLLGRTLGQNF